MPASAFWGQGHETVAVRAEWEEKATAGLRVAGGVLLPAISQPSYLPRGPGKFMALPLALTLGTLMWQIMKTKHTHSCFFPHSVWSLEFVLRPFFGLPPYLLQFRLTLLHR